MFVGNYCELSPGGETVLIMFQRRIMDGKLPSELTFTYDLIQNIRSSSLVYAKMSVHNCMTYITKEVLVSNHDCVLSERACYLNTPK
jgi:hypothetical protein